GRRSRRLAPKAPPPEHASCVCIIPVVERRGAAFARLFEAVHEGVYIGTIGPDATTTTFAANPYLKLIFGYSGDTAEADVRPFDHSRFVDPHARSSLLQRPGRHRAVSDYLVRLRRADNTAVWVELTARADQSDPDGNVR